MVQNHNAQIARKEIVEAQPKIAKAVPAKSSTDMDKLNKTEREFFNYLKRVRPIVFVQEITLKLADDCRYTPDFVTISEIGEIEFWEVKGFFRDDAKVKIKIAARYYRFLGTFTLAFKSKSGWDFQSVKP